MNEWDFTTDFISVGSGGGGLTAALAARSRGADALVLEKQPLVGGSTAWSGGVLWVPNSPLLRAKGIEDSYEKARAYLDAVVPDVGPASSDARRAAFLKEAPRLISFLQGLGVKFVHAEGYSDYYDDRPGGMVRGRSLEFPFFDLDELGPWAGRLSRLPLPFVVYVSQVHEIMRPFSVRGVFRLSQAAGRTWGSRLMKKRLVSNGAAMQGRILKACLEQDVSIWANCRVTGLITTDAGTVVGVEAVRNDRKVRVRARSGVLIASGGFARNPEMRAKYGPAPASTDWTVSNAGDTGEIQLEAMRLGAGVDLMDNAWWLPILLTPDGQPVYVLDAASGKPHTVIVDSGGQRFVNESANYTEVGKAMYDRHQVSSAVPSWIIIDRQHRNRYPWGMHAPVHTPRAWIDSGYLLSSPTIEGLAVKCGIDPASLRATIDRFNGFAKRGTDEDFGRGGREWDKFYGDPSHKPNPCLGTIEKAPFYAAKVYPGDVGTCGGLMTDAAGRVLRESGDPIPGLYATGNSTASVFGHMYPGAGASIAASCVWGMLAAEDAITAQSVSPAA
jgi:3-oxosteroid 1-dehydrogenase